MLARLLFEEEVQGQNLGPMMRRLRVDPSRDFAYNDGRTFRAAMKTCHKCWWTEDCKAWLKANPGTVDAAPVFCPNSIRFQSMRGDSW